MKKFILTSVAMFSMNTEAAVFTLGEDANCNYDSDNYSIQQVIDLVGTQNEIRITNQKEYFENLSIEDAITIKGGYANCTDALTDTVTGKTTIDGGSNGSVLLVSSNTSYITVSLHNILLENGKGQGSSYGGGISIIDNNNNGIDVRIYNSTIRNSEGDYGGGIFVNSDGLRANLYLYDSVIINNDAFKNGGGIYCNDGTVNLFGESELFLNDAYSNDTNFGNGGGIYATGGCLVRFTNSFTGQIYGNSASSHGGGFYVAAHSKVETISTNYNGPVVIKGNYSDSDNDFIGNGGGIYLTGTNAQLNLEGSLFEANTGFNGGGIAAFNGATVYLGKNQDTKCWDQTRCNVLKNNTTSKSNGWGGAIYLNDASAELFHTVGHGNRADLGAFLIAMNNADVHLRSSMIYRNGNGGLNDWSDIYAYKTYDSTLTMVNVTSANNPVLGAVISQSNSGHIIQNTIFFEPLQNVLADFVNTTSSTACILMDDDNGFESAQDSMVAPPLFIDPNNDNYHLTQYSPAIDMCSYSPLALSVDLDGNNTGWDDPNRINIFGSYDAGADESYAADVIFQSSF